MQASRLGLLAATAMIMAAAAGCSSLGMNNLGGIFGEDEKPAATEPAAFYQVIFVPTEGKPQQVQRTLSGPMHIQDALDQVGATKKFRRIEVELMRALPSGDFHRILCEYDLGTKRITPEFDYALLPGDRIVVKEDPRNVVDDMLASALGPLGNKFSSKFRNRGQKDSRYAIQR